MIRGEDWSTMRRLLLMHGAMGAPLKEYEVTGNPAKFETNVRKALTGFTIPFLPIQSGTGDPSPENVRPISGWTGVTAWRTGKNLLDPSLFETDNKSYIKYETGVTQTWSTAYRASDYVPIIAGFQYTLHAVMCGQNTAGTAFYDSEKQYISGFKMNSKTQTDYTFTVPEGAAYMRFCATDDIVSFDDVFLVFGDTAGSFKEYVTPTAYPVTFPETIYGGTLDEANSVVTGAWAAKIVRGTDLFYASASYIKSDAFDAFFYINDVYSGNGMCNMLKRSNAGIWGDVGYPNTMRINATQCHINIANEFLGITDYTQETTTTATQKLKAWLEELYNNGTPLIIVYPISTPYEIPLSDIPVPVTLKGDNTIWTDTNGSITIKYKKKG